MYAWCHCGASGDWWQIDEWGSGWSITGNAMVNAGESTGFYFSHSGRDNTLSRNIMINSTKGGLVARITGNSGESA